MFEPLLTGSANPSAPPGALKQMSAATSTSLPLETAKTWEWSRATQAKHILGTLGTILSPSAGGLQSYKSPKSSFEERQSSGRRRMQGLHGVDCQHGLFNAMGEHAVQQHSQNSRQVTQVLLLSRPPYL